MRTDIVVGFEHEADGRRFLEMMRDRPAEFALALHPGRGIVTKAGFDRVARQVRFRHGSVFLSPTSLPAAGHPARDLALSAVHPELPRRRGASARARPGGFL